MPLVARKFQTLDAVNTFLQGGIVSARDLPLREGKLYGLDGLTLIFSSPAVTVTFADPTGVGLDLKTVASQIFTGTASVVLAKFSREGTQTRLILIRVTPTTNVAITGAGTANPVFGFGDDAVAGTVYAPPDDAAPRLIATEGSHAADSIIIITEDT